MRQAVSLSGIHIPGAAYDILPRSPPSAVTRYYVIQGKVFRSAHTPAILAGVGITFEDVLAVELHLRNGKTIIIMEQKYLRQEDVQADGADIFSSSGRFVTGHRIIDPVRGTHWVIISIKGVNNPGVFLPKKAEGAAHSNDIHRLPIAVKDENPSRGFMGVILLRTVFNVRSNDHRRN
jgi:hypothetical protein